MPEPILAIDFGTSTSAAILVTDGREEIVGEASGTGLTWPSVVCLDGDELFVGAEAESRKRGLARQYRAEFKLELGRMDSIQLGEQSRPVQALITAVLAEMRTAAGRIAGESLTRAVLTIPAGYEPHDIRRALMIEAAEQAGFGVVELLAEPVAAALAPTAGSPFTPESLIVVYDFGGGTFDTALIRIGDSTNEVIGHAAIDHGSGGRDIDSALYGELLKAGGAPLAKLVKADRGRLELIARTEELKRRLTKATSAKDFIGDDDIELAATRQRLEELAGPVVERTIECVKTMLTATGTSASEVTEVLLVGGAAQMPIVEQAVHTAYGRPVRMARAPQLAVAQGAARFAAGSATRYVAPQARRIHENPLRWQIPGEAATLLRWRVPIGEPFVAGEVLADVRLTDGAIWELRAGEPGKVTDRHAPEGATVFSGEWLVTSTQPLRPKELFQTDLDHDINCVAFSPDGRSFATADDAGYATIFDAGSYAVMRKMVYESSARAYAVAYSPDGTQLAHGNGKNAVIWEVASGSALSVLSCGRVRALSFHPAGGKLAIATSDVRIWDLADDFTVICEDSASDVQFSADGTRLVSAHYDNKARVWTYPGAELVAEFEHAVAVNCVAFSPDGSRVAAGSTVGDGGGVATIWDLSSGERVISVIHELTSVEAIAFSPDGTLLATGVSVDECRVLDANTGDEVAVLDPGDAYGLAFSPDGRRIATASWDDTVRMWQLY